MARLDELIDKYARAYGLDPATLRAYVRIESSGNPNLVSSGGKGSYKGLLQLSEDEFNKYGGGDIFNPEDNIRAGAAKLADERNAFTRRYGRNPSATDLYLKHQQGEAGYAAHLKNPSGSAWQNIRPYYTDAAARRKGFASGDDYARAAIWDNVPDDVKDRYGSVDNMTSADFVSLWDGKVSRIMGKPQGKMQLAQAPQSSHQKGDSMFPIAAFLKALAGGGAAAGPAAASPAGGALAASGATGIGMESAADPNLFGSLSKFGSQSGEGSGSSNADSSLAAQAMQNAASPSGNQMATPSAPRFDAAQLQSLLQNAGRLGTFRPRRMG